MKFETFILFRFGLSRFNYFMQWQTSRRRLSLERPLVMAILNVTPDSFSDGGVYLSVDDALRQAKKVIDDGADIIDVGGESTRPGGKQIAVDEEIGRTIRVIEVLAKRFDTPISIDTTKSEVARSAVNAGAEIINDISGLRYDGGIAGVAADSGAGLVLMHSRGSFDSMHTEPPVNDIFADVKADFRRAIRAAKTRGVADGQIVLDVGIGFGKTFEQNLELIGKLDSIVAEFENYPMLVGASRKSFIGRLLGDAPVTQRFGGSVAAAIIAIQKGAKIVRVHDVQDTVAALKFLAAL